MAPTPQEIPREVDNSPQNGAGDGQRVVISGMSGCYPSSRNIREFSDILYNKVDPIADTPPRWNYIHPEVPSRIGLVPGLDQFDGQFFKVAFRLGMNMDPMSRKLLEHVYQAIYDAGVNPEHLSGKKIGVFIGSCLSETEKAVFYAGTKGDRTGLGIVGCSKSMFANRVSYWLNAKGPSLAIDGGCCSSAVALEMAYQALTSGDCESAIVGGSNLCLHPQTLIRFGRTIRLSKNGKTKSYDQYADGCVKSEAINVLFLQKAKDALRIYADVVHAKTKYTSYATAGTWSREKEEVTSFLKEFYDEIKISPQDVEFVEGFGAGDPDIDRTELEAIDNIFCASRERNEPLYIGSVMSNIGYSESATAITSITKVLLAYHTGQLAGNLHCSQPREDVAALRDGRLQVLRDHKPTGRSYIAVNGLSVTGLNSHVLLHGHYKPKDLTKYQCNLPRLVLLSSRMDTAVQNVIDNLKSRPIDAEELALINNIHSSKVIGHLGRGFTILDIDSESKTTCLCEKVEYFDGNSRPLWFVYSGMGSQWPGMGVQLMRIPIFAAAIERCRQVLEPKGIDIVHIITSSDNTIFDNILHSFVGIAAVQIGLTDVLLQLGLVPEKIIGHSVGELGCAYADGCLTAEEMILSAYSRGLVSVQTPFIRGSMAAVGIGFEEASKMCPPEIEVACHNAADSSTISGPADVMAQFVAELIAKDIFAKEVPCSNIAYHSRYIAEAGPKLLKYLREVIKTPKLRSERWVSTSVPQERWDEENAKYSSAEYHTNNLLSPVLFEEASRLIPVDAVLVEVAPHGLLQAILKRALPKCAHVPLTRRTHPDNACFLLEALGHLFMEGYYPDIRVLYPKVEFPVSTGTPHLSSLVEWAHQEQWPYPIYLNADRIPSSSCTFKVTLHDDEYLYLRGNQIGGKTVFPFAAALVCAWDTLAMVVRAPRRGLSVRFHDVVFFSQPTLHDSRLLRLTVNLHRGNGRFEIDDGITKVASGYVIVYEVDVKKRAENEETTNSEENDIIKEEEFILKKEEIYQILSESGYVYQDEFRRIKEMSGSLTSGIMSWNGRWESFLDGLFQLQVLRTARARPAFIREIIIDTEAHAKAIQQDTDLKAKVCNVHDHTRCGGITLTGIKLHLNPKSDENSLVIDTSKFDLRYPAGKVINDKNRGKTENRKELRIGKIGDLDTLHWEEAPTLTGAGIPIKVHFAGLNANDIIKTNGPSTDTQSPDSGEGVYGMDFSGITEDGIRVMGIVSAGAASSVVRARPELLWPVPAQWSLEDAATVPFAYAHALYFLAIKTDQMSPGVNILVSGGAGATGQAIIALALHSGCRVFLVLDDVRKKDFLMKLFPKLQADDIICCRDDSFMDRVMLATGGQGCEYVICSRVQRDAYVQCCGFLGMVIDVHQLKRNENITFKMHTLNNGRTYFTVDFSSLFLYNDIATFKKLQLMIAEGIAAGWVQPLSRVCYAPREAARAFRLLARGGHRGRVLLRVHDATSTQIASQTKNLEINWPTILRCSGGCQLVVGDVSGLAIRLAERLVRRGARALHLRLAHTEPLGRMQYVLTQALSLDLGLQSQEWRKSGVKYTISSEDLTQSECALNLLKQCLVLGPVEGIFVVMTEPLTDQTRSIYHTLLANLDEQTRKLCPSIKYFALIGVNNSLGEQVCVARAAEGLPAMMLSISINTETSGTLPSSYGDIINAMERGLVTMQPVLFAQYPPEESILEQIEKITGINIYENTSNNQTLQDLGLTKDKAQALSVYLRDNQNITIQEDVLALLSVEKLREVVETVEESDYVQIEGLSAFFPFVDSDELTAAMDTVVMPTLTQASDMRDDEFDGSEACLYIIPGMQGLHQQYRNLCERLQLAAVVLQPGLDNPDESLQDMTARYVTMFLKQKGERNTFYLLGHELGVLSVFGIAEALEDQGMTGTVFCLGGGPGEFQSELDRQLRVSCAGAADTEAALQDAVVRHLCALMGVASPELDGALRDAPTWPLKVETGVRALRGRVQLSMQYTRLLMDSAHLRVMQARRHTQIAPRALRSRVVLLRSPTPAAPNLLDLQRYSHQPLVVHELRAPYAHAVDDLRAASIINRYLDEETTNCFAQKSLCHTYLINPDSFFQNSIV